MKSDIVAEGWFVVVCRDRRGRIRWVEKVHNAATAEGIAYLLAAGFVAGTPVTTWYLGLIDSAGFTAVASGDTMAAHAGWAELQAYSQGARPAWGPGSPVAGRVINSGAVLFDVTADGTVRGLFAASNSTKGGTTGTLWATALLTSARMVSTGQQLQVIYSTTLTAN